MASTSSRRRSYLGEDQDEVFRPTVKGDDRNLPVKRNEHFEKLLVACCKERRTIELRYDDDVEPRIFNPHAVFCATNSEKVMVFGVQMKNPMQPMDVLKPRQMEVGRIRSIRVTDTFFRPDYTIDSQATRFRGGLLGDCN